MHIKMTAQEIYNILSTHVKRQAQCETVNKVSFYINDVKDGIEIERMPKELFSGINFTLS